MIVLFFFQYDLVGETDRKGDRDPKKRAGEIITKLDVSGDNKLNKQEFIAGYDTLTQKNLHFLFFCPFFLAVKTIQLFVVYSRQIFNKIYLKQNRTSHVLFLFFRHQQK